ncbi:hypothetical protein SAMN04487843_12672 [Methylobacterium sp. ap11]|jgi:hypothetical protein|uniref:hypothetical protein n=1 Tax=Methylobacterium sp. ap11 TaxID=1761799 RepID=UPI0008B64657|nr:hypothetical protein [Methylobacterium sp. ap11]SEP48178.1 hypothetical protein SAMN04487843_12672 [Methylobacterium sp. ap11]
MRTITDSTDPGWFAPRASAPLRLATAGGVLALTILVTHVAAENWPALDPIVASFRLPASTGDVVPSGSVMSERGGGR